MRHPECKVDDLNSRLQKVLAFHFLENVNVSPRYSLQSTAYGTIVKFREVYTNRRVTSDLSDGDIGRRRNEEGSQFPFPSLLFIKTNFVGETQVSYWLIFSSALYLIATKFTPHLHTILSRFSSQCQFQMIPSRRIRVCAHARFSSPFLRRRRVSTTETWCSGQRASQYVSERRQWAVHTYVHRKMWIRGKRGASSRLPPSSRERRRMTLTARDGCAAVWLGWTSEIPINGEPWREGVYPLVGKPPPPPHGAKFIHERFLVLEELAVAASRRLDRESELLLLRPSSFPSREKGLCSLHVGLLRYPRATCAHSRQRERRWQREIFAGSSGPLII